jgi:DNA-binding transcriptional MerR regulator
MDVNGKTLTIQEVAQATGLSVYTLRYYERIGLIHPIGRLANTHRRYTEWDVGWLDFLTKLRRTGMTIRDMQAYAELQRDGDQTLPQRLALLQGHYARVESHIADLEANLEIVRFKISLYSEQVGAQAPDTSCLVAALDGL